MSLMLAVRWGADLFFEDNRVGRMFRHSGRRVTPRSRLASRV
jgi:hypothetical protein